MTPETALLLAQLLLKYGPQVASTFHDIFTNKPVTEEEIKAMFATARKSYEDYVKGV